MNTGNMIILVHTKFLEDFKEVNRVMLSRKKGQSTLEYAIIIAVIAGALIWMSVYMRRCVEGRMRSSADQIGDQYSAGMTTQDITTQHRQEVTAEQFGVGAKGVSRYEVINPDLATKTGTETLTFTMGLEPLFPSS